MEISTAIVFFYRFFTRQSFSEHGHYVRFVRSEYCHRMRINICVTMYTPKIVQVVALACIFLATKVESGVKGRADDLILADYSLRRKKKYESMKNLINKLRHKKKPRHDDPALKVPSLPILAFPFSVFAVLDNFLLTSKCSICAGVLGAKRPTSYL